MGRIFQNWLKNINLQILSPIKPNQGKWKQIHTKTHHSEFSECYYEQKQNQKQTKF